MGVHIQVRDVPDAVFLALKARAVASGQTLSELLRGLLADAVPEVPRVPAPKSWDDGQVPVSD